MKPNHSKDQPVNPEISAPVELIDTYDLFAGVLEELGGPSCCFLKLDNTLPVIFGNRVKLRQLVQLFLSDYLKSLSSGSEKGQALLSHSKNRLDWVFFIQTPAQEVSILPLTSLSIPKASLQEVYFSSIFKGLAS